MHPLPSSCYPPEKRRAFALVLVLSLLVLLAGMIIAFFSRAALQRQIASSNTAQSQAALLAASATQQIMGDLLTEIEAGSDADLFATTNPNATVKVWSPKLASVSGVSGSSAPSMVPQRIAANGARTVLKKSRQAVPFFSGTVAGYATSPSVPVRASEAATTGSARGGRTIALSRWNKPQLLTPSEESAFTAPDWVYVNRKGENPTVFAAADLKTYASRTRGNESYVIGRYACVVYDVGGLLDINTIGNGLTTDANANRGRLSQVTLANGIDGVAVPKFAQFIDWRWPTSKSNAALDGDGLFSPTRTFLDVLSGEQALVSRQDLIRLAKKQNPLIPTEALPYLTTFSRSVNAPAYLPDPSRPKLPASPSPDEINPALSSVRFASTITLPRPGKAVSVKGGAPVMPRRFPLSKLRLFEESNPNPAEMLYYFGLEKQGTSWRYARTTITKGILTLAEVAAAGREPNLFEVLQAGIYTGSLGKYGGDGETLDDARDQRRDLQIMQIGANLIDQWDADDLPTTLIYPFADPTDPLIVHGVENLPYIAKMMVTPIHTGYNPDLLQLWLLFDVWNPHQNATTTPVGIQSFRIRPVSGKGRISTSYFASFGGKDNDKLTQNEVTPTQSIPALNQAKPLTFSASGNYSEATTIGDGNPDTSTKIPGILLGQTSRTALIPPPEQRPKDLQTALNEVHEIVSPYTTTPADASYSTDASGHRVYPAGTVISNETNHWTVSSGTSSPKIVYANHGVKSPNMIQFKADPAELVDIELQWLPIGSDPTDDSAWRPYQRIEGLFHDGTETITHAREYYSSGSGNELLVHTHHSAIPRADIPANFYQWRTDVIKKGTGLRTFTRPDPRSTRFGFGAADTDHLGLNFRSISQAWNGADKKEDTKWLQWKTWYPGREVAPGFERWKASLFPPFGTAINNPEVDLSGSNPVRYSDTDGVIRPADGFFGSDPVISVANGGKLEDRPRVLNRPFRSVGELGYVFRDTPWKTLDFSTRYSADLGLADYFTLDEVDAIPALVAGKVNLNTASKAVLQVLLDGIWKQEANVGVSAQKLSSTEASSIAAAIEAEAKKAPFRNRGDFVARVLHASGGPLTDKVKIQREAAVRALAEMTETRTWNLMIDVIAQTGAFPMNASSTSDFLVKSESRRWVHVAIDRITGEIISMQTEEVYE